MSKFIKFWLVFGLGVASWPLYNLWQDPPGPSETAQVLIDSMKKSKGWRVGREDTYIVNEKAGIAVYESGEVWLWDKTRERNRYVNDRWARSHAMAQFSSIGWWDRRWIKSSFWDARKAIERQLIHETVQ